MDELQRQIRDAQRIINSSPASSVQAKVSAFQQALKGLDSVNSVVARIAATHSAVLVQNPLSGITRVIDAINENAATFQASTISDIVRQQKSIENAASATAKVFATIAPIRLAETSVLATVAEANRTLAAMMQGPANIAALAGKSYADLAYLLTPSAMELAVESISRQFGPLRVSPLENYLTRTYSPSI